MRRAYVFLNRPVSILYLFRYEMAGNKERISPVDSSLILFSSNWRPWVLEYGPPKVLHRMHLRIIDRYLGN